jgi:nitroimidazol reductase NimA-like FMN-containing flavoprotein (pyridoxamine 5'-phosphate oxidase superfamily)
VNGPETVARTARGVELTREECLERLASVGVGRVAVQLGDGAPLIRPVNHRFDAPSQSIVFRTGAGSKLVALLASARAAFEVDELDPVSRTGWSVIVLGVAEVVASPAEIARLDATPLEGWTGGERTRWVQIRAETVSGRRIITA